ncbi:MAG: integration host factor subunit beta [Nitrospiraceae bacterium]|nr:integration host factor subunit beta [Nitrospiraceae bacterium]
MTKRELVIRVANKLGMTQNDVAKIVEGTFETISHKLADGKRWELRDFGVFEVKTRASRIGRNPRTGDQVPVPERRVVTFRPGKRMKEVIAAGASGQQEPQVPAAPPQPEAETSANPAPQGDLFANVTPTEPSGD